MPDAADIPPDLDDLADDGGPDLWELVRSPGWIDERDVIPALRRTLARDVRDLGGPDERTKMLAHDSLVELERRHGPTATNARIDGGPLSPLMRELWRGTFEKVGFPALRYQLVQATDPKDVLAMFRTLGRQLRRPASITVGGSIALMLRDLLHRETQDIDVVDELPEVVRVEHQLLHELLAQYRLQLTHFGSHYLPDGWKRRTSSFGVFDRLDVRLVDALDVLAGKVFSKRRKDQQDLHATWPKIDQARLRERVAESTAGLRKVPGLEEVAADNWYVLTGEQPLPGPAAHG